MVNASGAIGAAIEIGKKLQISGLIYKKNAPVINSAKDVFGDFDKTTEHNNEYTKAQQWAKEAVNRKPDDLKKDGITIAQDAKHLENLISTAEKNTTIIMKTTDKDGKETFDIYQTDDKGALNGCVIGDPGKKEEVFDRVKSSGRMGDQLSAAIAEVKTDKVSSMGKVQDDKPKEEEQAPEPEKKNQAREQGESNESRDDKLGALSDRLNRGGQGDDQFKPTKTSETSATEEVEAPKTSAIQEVTGPKPEDPEQGIVGGRRRVTAAPSAALDGAMMAAGSPSQESSQSLNHEQGLSLGTMGQPKEAPTTDDKTLEDMYRKDLQKKLNDTNDGIAQRAGSSAIVSDSPEEERIRDAAMAKNNQEALGMVGPGDDDTSLLSQRHMRQESQDYALDESLRTTLGKRSRSERDTSATFDGGVTKDYRVDKMLATLAAGSPAEEVNNKSIPDARTPGDLAAAARRNENAMQFRPDPNRTT